MQCRLQNLRGDGRTCQSPPLFPSRSWSLQLVADSESSLNTGDIYEREARLIIDYSVLTADLQVGPQSASVPPQPQSQLRNQRGQVNISVEKNNRSQYVEEICLFLSVLKNKSSLSDFLMSLKSIREKCAESGT